jgi:hypothetical protein
MTADYCCCDWTSRQGHQLQPPAPSPQPQLVLSVPGRREGDLFTMPYHREARKTLHCGGCRLAGWPVGRLARLWPFKRGLHLNADRIPVGIPALSQS